MIHYNKLVFFLVAGFVVLFATGYSQPYTPEETDKKLMTAFKLIQHYYVDTAKEPALVEKAIISMLKELDPHSVYMNKEEIKKANEPLIGNFEGIGIQFQILHDTIIVVAALSGGPSEKLGILAGDKIITIDGENSTGDKVSNSYVRSKLLGKKGSEVKVSIYRKGRKTPLEYTIIRDKIPIHSAETYFMATEDIGYIKVNRFSRNTMSEYHTAVKDLKSKNMKHLILDLRGNSGGYLHTAIALADEFLTKDKLIVFTEGKRSPKKEFKATAKGSFNKGKIVVLIDRRSASASEIVSGAIQDWDRGLIIGRRSFGKGLVQKPFKLPDQAVIRLTTARYHTPTGRCIQKSYDDGVKSYYKELSQRYKHGEFVNPDSIKFPDSLKYYTPAKRIVYGGGGIMPDIFIPVDTTRVSNYYSDLLRKNVINSFALEYTNNNRNELLSKYHNLDVFIENFSINKDISEKFNNYIDNEGIKKTDPKLLEKKKQLKKELTELIDSLSKEKINPELLLKKFSIPDSIINKFEFTSDKEFQFKPDKSEKYIFNNIKALIARNLWGIKAYFEVRSKYDKAFNKAIEVIEDKSFKKMNINYN